MAGEGSTSGETGADTPAAAHLTAEVKSAILDRLLGDLGAESSVAGPRSVYTKSDSGLYGRYEKHDADQMLALIRDTVDKALADYATLVQGPAAATAEDRPSTDDGADQPHP